MSWGLGWKRPSDVFHLSLFYGSDEALDDQTRSSSPPQSSSVSSSASQDTNNNSNSNNSSNNNEENDQNNVNNQELGFRIDLDWNAGDDEDQVTLRLQSQVMVALPLPQDTVVIRLLQCDDSGVEGEGNLVNVDMKVVKQREPLRGVAMSRVAGSGQQNDGMGVLIKLLKSDFAAELGSGHAEGPRVECCSNHWMNVTVVSLCNCGLSVSS